MTKVNEKCEREKSARRQHAVDGTPPAEISRGGRRGTAVSRLW